MSIFGVPEVHGMQDDAPKDIPNEVRIEQIASSQVPKKRGRPPKQQAAIDDGAKIAEKPLHPELDPGSLLAATNQLDDTRPGGELQQAAVSQNTKKRGRPQKQQDGTERAVKDLVKPLRRESESESESDFEGAKQLSGEKRKADRQQAAAIRGVQRERAQWLKYTVQDRAIYEGVKQAESRDLAAHLVHAHGLASQQYAKLISQDLGRIQRHKWAAGWVPPLHWTSWPLEPKLVPRPMDRVWQSSIAREEPWIPSRELEEELFAFLLRKARKQWKGDITLDLKAVESSNPSREARKRKFEEINEDVLDKPVISTDDEHSQRILQPIIKSTLSKLDALLIAMEKSRAHAVKTYGTRRPYGARGPKKKETVQIAGHSNKGKIDPNTAQVDSNGSSPSSTELEPSEKPKSKPKDTRASRAPVSDVRREREHSSRDWSHVLGTASIIGVSPEVIARAATRCAAIFNENLVFHTLPEDNYGMNPKDLAPILNPKAAKRRSASLSTPNTVQKRFTPSDTLHIRNPSSRLKCEPSNIDFSNLNVCPVLDCEHSPTQPWNRGEVMDHMMSVHGLDITKVSPEQLEEKFHLVGGVHNDGYMQPLKAEQVDIAASASMTGQLPGYMQNPQEVGKHNVTRQPGASGQQLEQARKELDQAKRQLLLEKGPEGIDQARRRLELAKHKVKEAMKQDKKANEEERNLAYLRTNAASIYRPASIYDPASMSNPGRIYNPASMYSPQSMASNLARARINGEDVTQTSQPAAIRQPDHSIFSSVAEHEHNHHARVEAPQITSNVDPRVTGAAYLTANLRARSMAHRQSNLERTQAAISSQPRTTAEAAAAEADAMITRLLNTAHEAWFRK